MTRILGSIGRCKSYQQQAVDIMFFPKAHRQKFGREGHYSHDHLNHPHRTHPGSGFLEGCLLRYSPLELPVVPLSSRFRGATYPQLIPRCPQVAAADGAAVGPTQRGVLTQGQRETRHLVFGTPVAERSSHWFTNRRRSREQRPGAGGEVLRAPQKQRKSRSSLEGKRRALLQQQLRCVVEHLCRGNRWHGRLRVACFASRRILRRSPVGMMVRPQQQHFYAASVCLRYYMSQRVGEINPTYA